MDELLNCFQWRRHVSDLLDDSLPADTRQEVQKHFRGCSSCEASFQRYVKIVAAIRGQSKAEIPEALKRAPLSAILPQITSSQFSISRWEKLPWYFRVTLETAGIVAIVFLGISSAPYLRNIYERSVEKNLNDFKEMNPAGESSKDFAEGSIPLLEDQPQAAKPSGSESGVPPVEEGDELSGENDRGEVLAGRSGNHQLWRFTLKSVSPDELRHQVIRALTDLKISDKTPGLAGMTVPGGIEFKMLLPEEKITDVKAALQRLAPPSTEDAKVIPGTETFTWYRVKSKNKVPEGKAKVIIWLSQPN